MNVDKGTEMKLRLRTDLTAAMKRRASAEVKLIRSLIAAIDNAEAEQAPIESASLVRHDFAAGTAEVQRRHLDASSVARIIGAEADERDLAAAEYDRIGLPDRAQELRADAALARRYFVA